MKIVQLTAENIKRLSAVEIKPGAGGLVVIGGRNAQGKTSVLDSIEMALAGGRHVPERPIHDGADKARVVVETEEYRVTRSFTTKGNYLVVEPVDGKSGPYPSPQALLDKLVGDLTFDPLGFSRMKPAQQAEVLKRLTGLDFSEVDAERAKTYEDRTALNREVKALEARLAGLPVAGPKPPEPPGVDALQERQDAMLQHNEDLDQAVRKRAEAHEDAQSSMKAIAELEAELERERALLEKRKIDWTRANARVEELGEKQDPGELRDQLNGVMLQVKAVQEWERKQAEREGISAELAAKRREACDCTRILEEIDAEKREALAACKMPVPGLAFTDAGPTLNGVPFTQASSAEQLRVSVAVGLAMNPTLRVLLVRDGSLLDEDNLKLLADMAEEAGAQVWVERVGAGAEVSVVIEDGTVAEAR